MRILLAAPRGYCAGVEMALAALDATLARHGAPVHCYHQIVHNRWLVAHYEARGVTFVNEVDEVPPGGVLVFSAHGVSPAVRARAQARGLTVIDATCPLVHKVHAEARRYAQRGDAIVYVGHAGHDEAVGVTGEAPDAVRLVEHEEDVARLEVADGQRVVCLTQTTLSVDDTRQLLVALRRRFPQLQAPPQEDICYATQNRQEAVRRLAAHADVALVVGSVNSSNSKRLCEVAASQGARAYLFDTLAEIDPSWLADAETVVLTAGASAPEQLVEETLAWLVARFGATVEHHVLLEEDVHFNLPPQLRAAAPTP
jgi:4-hydroxy-3-methylbut-2-enyl diphosphate reductase